MTTPALQRSDPVAEGERIAAGYEAIAHLRRGRDCDVYDAWSEERDCRCVVKCLRPDRRAHERARRRLRREGQLLLSIAHPHIVRAYELIRRPDPVLIVETIDGETVGHLAQRRQRRLPSTDIAYLGMHLCSAVQYLHRRGILHLDLKPSNVISDRGQAKVIDLSIARAPGRGRRGVGTPRYMAPEQVLGSAVGPPTDVWGIGAVLFEAATARAPWPERPAGDLNGTGHSLVSPDVRDHRRLPADLSGAINSCLALDPDARPELMALSTVLDGVAMRAMDRGAPMESAAGEHRQ
jgi:serine/threonine protein kinase